MAEERLKPRVFALQPEVGADVRVRVDELAEVGRVEAQGEHVGAGADGGGARRALEQLGFAEAVAIAQHVERDLVGIGAPFDDAGAAGDEDVEAIGRVRPRRPSRSRMETRSVRSAV